MEGSMSEYQLEIKQIVDYPRYRIYRHFIQNLMADRSIRTSGGSHIQKGAVRFGMAVSCGEDKPVYTFELTLSPTEKDREGGARA